MIVGGPKLGSHREAHSSNSGAVTAMGHQRSAVKHRMTSAKSHYLEKPRPVNKQSKIY